MAYSLTFSIVSTILVFLGVVTLYDYVKKRQFFMKHAKNIPQLPYLPWIGALHYFYKVFDSGIRVVEIGMKVTKSDTYMCYLGNMPIYVTTNADDFEAILPNELKRTVMYNFIDDNLEGYSLLGATVANWKVDRRIMNKAFKERSLNEKIPFINESTEKHFGSFPREENIQPALSRILRCIMEGVIYNFFPCYDLNDERSFLRIHNSMKASMQTPYRRFVRPWLYPKTFFEMSSMKKKVNYLNEQANIDAIAIIERTRKKRLAGTLDNDTDDIITNLEKAGIADDIILSEIKLLTAAGTHTTSITVAFIVLALGIYPEYQEKVLEEVLRVVGPTDTIETSHMQQLLFTKMFVKEVLRLFPAVPLMMRKTTKELDLGNGNILPKNLDICLSIYSLHRNEKYWKNPLEFNPYRFAPEEIKKMHPYAFLPFSAGARNCIGYKYAWNVVLISMTLLVRKYKISCSRKSLEEIEIKSFMTMDIEDKESICTFTPRQLDAQ